MHVGYLHVMNDPTPPAPAPCPRTSGAKLDDLTETEQQYTKVTMTYLSQTLT